MKRRLPTQLKVARRKRRGVVILLFWALLGALLVTVWQLVPENAPAIPPPPEPISLPAEDVDLLPMDTVLPLDPEDPSVNELGEAPLPSLVDIYKHQEKTP